MNWKRAGVIVALLNLAAVSTASADLIRWLEDTKDPGSLVLEVNAAGAGTDSQPVTITVPGDRPEAVAVFPGSGWLITNFDLTYNIVDPVTGAISDLLEIRGSSSDPANGGGPSLRSFFSSDSEAGPPLVPFVNPIGTIIETGAVQDIVTIAGYAHDPAGLPHDLTVSIRSDVESVPEPATLALLGLAIAGMAASLRRKLQ